MAAAAPSAAAAAATAGAGGDSKGNAVWSRTVLRRRQRQATLQALKDRVGHSQEEGLAAELVHRLVLVAPVLAAGLCGATVAPLVRRRRNTARARI